MSSIRGPKSRVERSGTRPRRRSAPAVRRGAGGVSDAIAYSGCICEPGSVRVLAGSVHSDGGAVVGRVAESERKRGRRGRM